jgi:hypothetical protein
MKFANRLACAPIVVLLAGCNITSAGSPSREQTSPSPLPSAKAEPNPTVYSGNVQVRAADTGRTITVLAGLETATDVSEETLPAVAIRTGF